MKQMAKWIVFTMMVFMVAGGQAIAANGSGQSSKNCIQNQSQTAKGSFEGPCQLIAAGEKMTVSGTVYEAPYAGQGLTVDTGQELITIYGFGPQWYWDLSGVDKPDVGETVEIKAVKVTFSDQTEKIIAMSVTIGEDVVQFRDSNGRPMWRGKGRLS